MACDVTHDHRRHHSSQRFTLADPSAAHRIAEWSATYSTLDGPAVMLPPPDFSYQPPA
jgi:hypothetical protein